MDFKYPILRKMISDNGLCKERDIICVLNNLEKELIEFRKDICYLKKIAVIEGYILQVYNIKRPELAKKINLSFSYLYRYASGKKLDPGMVPIKFETIIKLLDLIPDVPDFYDIKSILNEPLDGKEKGKR